MRISDWSSDVCSSDLVVDGEDWIALRLYIGAGGECKCRISAVGTGADAIRGRACGTEQIIVVSINEFGIATAEDVDVVARNQRGLCGRNASVNRDRKSVVWGKRVSVRVDLGGRSIIKKKQDKTNEK